MTDTKKYASTDQCKTEDILESTVGNFGKWQLRISACMALLKLPMAWFQLGIIFLAPPTQYWCRQPEDFKMMTLENWLDYIKPFGNETNYAGSTSGCTMRHFELPTSNELVPCKWGFDYNRTIIQTSIITEFDLVCGNERLVDISQMTLMLGVLLGNIIFGVIADKYGRKRTLIITITMQAICGIFSAWSPWIHLFIVLRFFMAMANGGSMISSFVMCMEIVGGSWRSIVPILYQIPFGLGTVMMAGLAYSMRTWRELQVTLSICSAVFILYIWLIPESPRWLLATGNRKEAAKVLEKAAKLNNLDPKIVRSAFVRIPVTDKQKPPQFGDILKSAELRKRSLFLCINWFLNGITFYGFSQYIGHVGSNLFLNVALTGIITLPGTLLCVFIIKRYGRKWTLVFANFFIGLCFFGILLVPKGIFADDWPKLMLATMSVVGLSIGTPTLYLYTGELFPTVLRNVGVGSSSMCSRIGAMVAPFIISLQFTSYYLPLICLGLAAILQGILVLPLPESTGHLPETINDVEMGTILNNNDMVNGSYLAVPTNKTQEDQ